MDIDLTAGGYDWRSVYHLCISFITPRPIALVSTISPNGAINLAPFSFYNMVSANPPVVVFCPGLRRDGSKKDTLRNIEHNGEFAIATVTPDIASPMVACAVELPYKESEFAFSGLTPAPASVIRPPLIAQAKVNIECRQRQYVRLGDGPGSSTVVFGDIVAIHVADELLDTARRACDPQKLTTVGRLGGTHYSKADSPFSLPIPERPRS